MQRLLAAAQLSRYANARQFPIIPCNLCGSQENLQRAQIKQLLQTWERDYPGRTESLFRSLQNVLPSQLADTELYDFGSLENQRVSDRDGQTQIEDFCGKQEIRALLP
jgi:tRNA 2-thiocytidine biosynthesis protein TtcA